MKSVRYATVDHHDNVLSWGLKPRLSILCLVRGISPTAPVMSRLARCHPLQMEHTLYSTFQRFVESDILKECFDILGIMFIPLLVQRWTTKSIRLQRLYRDSIWSWNPLASLSTKTGAKLYKSCYIKIELFPCSQHVCYAKLTGC